MLMLEEKPKNKQDKHTVSLMIALQSKGIIKEIQDAYLYWDKLKYKYKEYDSIDLWNAVKLHRLLNSNEIPFGKYKFHYVITDFMLRALHQFDMHFGGTLGSNIGIAETDKNIFIISSLIEEAISSSQIEGANTTRKQAKQMIRKQQKPISKSEQMILNNYKTMKHIVQLSKEDISPEKILQIHQLIVHKTLDNDNNEGQYRDNDDIYVIDYLKSEVVHTPPPASELKGLITDLCVFFNTDTDDFIHPVIKGIIIHFMIGWIHPFVDGNGRTARAIFYWYMLKKGYWLTEYLSISRIIKDTKNQYEKAFLYSEIDDKDLSYFITYHIKTMEKAYSALESYITRKQREVFQAAKFLKIPSVNERMAQILKILHEDAERILNAKEIETRFSISNFTARSDLKELVALGFLKEIQVNKKKKSYIKSENFNEILKQYKL